MRIPNIEDQGQRQERTESERTESQSPRNIFIVTYSNNNYQQWAILYHTPRSSGLFHNSALPKHALELRDMYTLETTFLALRHDNTTLQPAAVDDLVVDGELTALVADDQNADGATAVVEAVGETLEQAALVDDRETLLDITGLGHGDDAAVIANVEHAVLLEDWADHVLDDDRRGRVADERRLLVQLLGEQVYTEVAVLAGLGRGGDADDLAGAALQDQEITDADVVAWDGDGVGRATAALAVAGGALLGVAWGTHGNLCILDDDVFLDTLVVVVVLLAVEDSVGSFVETVAERVVLTLFVVISHIKTVPAFRRPGWVDGAFFADGDLLVEAHGFTLGEALLGVLAGIGALVLGEWDGAGTKVSLGNVNAGVDVDLGGGRVTGRVLAVVDTVFDVNLCVGVTLVRFLVAVKEDEVSQSTFEM